MREGRAGAILCSGQERPHRVLVMFLILSWVMHAHGFISITPYAFICWMYFKIILITIKTDKGSNEQMSVYSSTLNLNISHPPDPSRLSSPPTSPTRSLPAFGGCEHRHGRPPFLPSTPREPNLPPREAGVSQEGEALKVESDAPRIQPNLTAPATTQPSKEPHQRPDFQCRTTGFHSKLHGSSGFRLPQPSYIF